MTIFSMTGKSQLLTLFCPKARNSVGSLSLLAPVPLLALLTVAFQHRICVSKVSRYGSEYRIRKIS